LEYFWARIHHLNPAAFCHFTCMAFSSRTGASECARSAVYSIDMTTRNNWQENTHMSWNEPGGNKKDPWSGRDQPGGPPDVEEIVRSLQEKIGRFFGGGRAGGSGTRRPSRAIWLLVGLALIIWLLSGIYIIGEGNRGVITRFGKFIEMTLPGPHWHLPAPIESVSIVNVEQQQSVEVGYRSGGRQPSLGSVPREALMLTQDENIVDIRLGVQYQIKNARDYLFNVADVDATLRQVAESAVRSVVGKNNMDFILTEGRSAVAGDIKTDIQKNLDQYNAGIQIMSVNLIDAQPPEEVQGAFEDAIKAREDEQRLKNEAEAYANEVIPKARGAAARLTEESEAYKQRVVARAEGEASRFDLTLREFEKAPEVTRKRLYIDAIEAVLGQSDVYLLDVKGSNNLIYLPLDKLPGKATALPESATGNAEHVPSTHIQPANATSSARSSTRGRDGRGQ
jgi:membrane protease subunit HflK